MLEQRRCPKKYKIQTDPYLKHSRRSWRPYLPAWYACPSITDATVSESSTITATSLSLFPSMLRSFMLAEPVSGAEQSTSRWRCSTATQHHRGPPWPAQQGQVTDDDGVVVSDEHFAVHVDQLRHQFRLQLGVSPQTSKGDVVHPLVPHWEGEQAREGWWELPGCHIRLLITDIWQLILSLQFLLTGAGSAHTHKPLPYPQVEGNRKFTGAALTLPLEL